jgi:hypothetical protein
VDSSPVRYRVRRRLCGVMDGRRVGHHRDAALNGATAGLAMARPAPAMAVPTLGLVPKRNREPGPHGLRARCDRAQANEAAAVASEKPSNVAAAAAPDAPTTFPRANQ